MRHISYPKIEQFRNVVYNIRHHTTYTGEDENGDPIYDNSKLLPKVTFKGTVKLHGTNAAVCYNSKDGLWTQSRSNIITVGKDNAAFALFVHGNKEVFENLTDEVACRVGALNTDTITIYGEWAGKSIQKGIAIAELPKAFYIFGVKITPENVSNEIPAYWVDSSDLRCRDRNIYNIEDFPTYEIEIDFNHPELSSNLLASITEEVENECPVASSFGVKGIGEGVVWSAKVGDVVHRFKVKGEKHSVSKVKTLAPVDVEKVNSVIDFVEYSATKARYDQAISIVFPDGNKDIKKLGDLIRWVVNDIHQEELDVLIKNNLTPKDVNSAISNSIRKMFFKDISI